MTEKMEKRKYKRMPSNIRVRFSCLQTDYSGTVTNISENGMFIKAGKMSFPFDSCIEVLIHLKNQVFKVPVEVRRMSKSSDHYDGLGVKLISTPQEFIDLVNTYKMIHQNRTAFTLN